MGRFLIDNVPPDAVYTTRSKFVNDVDETTLINTVQMVDPRFTLEDITRIEQSASPPELAHFFEITEKIESSKRAECLHSFSLFKMEAEDGRGTTGKRFDDYLNGLIAWVDFFDRLEHHKLRVYVGDSAWDSVYQAGLLDTQSADFYRMRDSSEHTEIGTFWRFLAFDDYDYDYVWIRETDANGEMINNEWVMNPKEINITEYDDFKSCLAGEPFCFRSDIIGAIPRERRDGSIPQAYPLLFWADDYRLSDPLYVHRLSEYIQSSTPSLMRGTNRLPFSDISKIFCAFFRWHSERIIYRDGAWTNVRERHLNLNLRYIDENWLFMLTKVIPVAWRFRLGLVEIGLQRERYGQDWFLHRLCDDLRENGNTFSHSFLPGYVFDTSAEETITAATQDKKTNETKLFFIPPLETPFTNHFEYAQINNIFDVVKSQDRYNDFINKVQVIDPRWTQSDLDRVNSEPAARLAEMFNIRDKIEPASRGEALCSICLFSWEDTQWSRQPFQEYFDGLKERIRIFRDELPNQTLRVYVANDVWDVLHKEGILSENHVEFIRMTHTSHASRFGMLWRQLAFDDYDYPYVYLEDTDLRPNELRVTMEILERMFSCEKQNFEPHIVSSLSFNQDFVFNLFYETSTKPTDHNESTLLNGLEFLWRIVGPENYYKTSILTMARGPKRLPFANIVNIFSEVLFNLPHTYEVVFQDHSFSHYYMSHVTDIMPTLQSHEIGESWVFYLSKLMDIKMWVEPRHMELIEKGFARYGDSFFWRRIQEQMLLDGNYLACGDQGVELLAFERFYQ